MYWGGADIGLAIGGTLIQHYSWHAGSSPTAVGELFMFSMFLHFDCYN